MTAAGSNTWIQYSDGTDLAASGNFKYNDATQQLTLSGNANITNTLKVNQEQLTSVLTQQIIYANGSSYLVGSANFTFNESTSQFQVTGSASVTGNANIGNIGTGGIITATGNITGGNLVTSGVVSATGDRKSTRLNSSH